VRATAAAPASLDGALRRVVLPSPLTVLRERLDTNSPCSPAQIPCGARCPPFIKGQTRCPSPFSSFASSGRREFSRGRMSLRKASQPHTGIPRVSISLWTGIAEARLQSQVWRSTISSLRLVSCSRLISKITHEMRSSVFRSSFSSFSTFDLGLWTEALAFLSADTAPPRRSASLFLLLRFQYSTCSSLRLAISWVE